MFVGIMPIRLTDNFCVPGSATVSVALVGVSPTNRLSINRIGVVGMNQRAIIGKKRVATPG